MSRYFWKEFLDVYMSMPSLWKVKSPDYCNRAKKNQCYDILADMCREVEPSADRAFVQRKINSFRTTFRKEHKKVIESKKSCLGTSDVHEPTLWYYDVLLPAVLQSSPRSSTSTAEDAEFAQDISNFEDSEADAEDIKNASEASPSVLEVAVNAPMHPVSTPPASVGAKRVWQESKNSELLVTPRKQLLSRIEGVTNEANARASMIRGADNGRMRPVATLPAAVSSVGTKREWQESTNNELLMLPHKLLSTPSKENDDFDLFGMNTAAKMRKISEINNVQYVIAEKLISDVIFHAQLESLTFNTVIKIPDKDVN